MPFLFRLDRGIHALLAHLQQGSLTVTPGTLVVPGQPLARCGNSGRSPQPHLHLHVQRGPMLGASTLPFHLAFVTLTEASTPLPGTTPVPTPVLAPAVLRFNAIPRVRQRVTPATVDPNLAAAMHHPVGRRYAYRGEPRGLAAHRWEAVVELDLRGRAWLVASSGARIAIAESDCALALYDRQGPGDPLLDALALAAGLTPLIGDRAEWHDAPPAALLPLPRSIRMLHWLVPGLPRVKSRYRRQPSPGGWHQEGHHQVLLGRRALWSCKSSARILEGEGVSTFEVTGADGARVGARLVSHGLKSDIGIPGWNLPARLAA